MKNRSKSFRVQTTRWSISALFLVAIASQAKLQTLESRHTIALADQSNRYELTERLPASRGRIVASDGQVLAEDQRVYDLNVDFHECPDTEAFWVDLAQASGIPATDFSILAESGIKSRTWPGAIEEGRLKAIAEVRSRWHSGGVSVLASGYRAYPLGDQAACLVGVIRRRAYEVASGGKAYDLAVRENGEPTGGRPAVGDMLTGLERARDQALRGQDGVVTGAPDRSGRLLPMRSQTSDRPRKDGEDVTVTIDTGLQAQAAAAVKSAVESSQAESGVAVIEDPSTGNLLAVANWPSFAPYEPDGNYGPMGPHGGLNPAYMSCLEPGSMFKILTLAKALDEHVVTMNDTFYCAGEKEVVPGQKPIKCDLHHGNRAHGRIDPIMAIARSCNIWAATWAYKIGYQKFTSYLDALGLFDRPGIGMPGEIRGLFDRNDPDKDLQVANVGFGQSINCTPIALAGAFSTIANGGVHLAPRLIERIGDRMIPVNKGTTLLSKEACDDVVRGMEAVIQDPRGTGYALRIPGYELAGKTGTAQKIGKGVHGHVSNFVGFVPAVKPRAVILVMVNNPKKQYYGAETAGPAFKTIAQAVIRRFHIAPTNDGDSGVRRFSAAAVRSLVRPSRSSSNAVAWPTSRATP